MLEGPDSLNLLLIYPDLPVLCDPSHIGGKRDLIQPLCQQAMDLNYEGLIVETHCDPDNAWSDAKQQVTPTVLKTILEELIIRDTKVTTEDLKDLRKQIDELDQSLLELLSKRMRVSREIGTFKKEHGMPIIQQDRYGSILKGRIAEASEMGMNPEFMRVVLEAIHEESVRQQLEIVSK